MTPEWEEEYADLHGYGVMRAELDARFEERFLAAVSRGRGGRPGARLPLRRTAEIIPAMLALRSLLAIGYLAGTVALAFVLWVSGVYGNEEVDGSGWSGDVDAWQWDAILFLGFAGLIVGLLALVRRALAALALHAVLTGAGVALVLQADVVSPEQLALGWLATFAAGAGFMRARR